MNSNQMEDLASDLQCAAGTKSIILQIWDYIKTNPSTVGVNGPRYEIEQPRCAPRAYGVHVRQVHLATKRVTTQLVNICFQTKSVIAHSIVNVRVKAMFVRGSSTHQAIARTQLH